MDRANQRGVALILVTFLVALASILVLDLAYATFLGSRQHQMTERALVAEYLLKSGVNLARVLIREDTTPEDSPADSWGFFREGATVPGELLATSIPNVLVSLEIRPEGAKLPINALVRRGTTPVNTEWRDIFVRLFKILGFDGDDERDDSGIAQTTSRFFGSEELVANLIDYLDEDGDSYNEGGFAPGIEDELPKDFFPNRGQMTQLDELRQIPGFTANRVRKLIPYVHTVGVMQVNINVAPPPVLKSLSTSLLDPEVEEILRFRNDPNNGPFTSSNRGQVMTRILGSAQEYDRISSRISSESSWFQVIGKVDFGTTAFFIRASLSKRGTGRNPVIASMELY